MRALLILLPALLMAQAPPPSARPADSQSTAALATDDEKTVYSIGLSIYASLAQLDLSPGEFEIVERALADAAAGKPAIDVNAWGPKIDPFTRARIGRVAEREKAASKGFLEKAASEPGAVRTTSGLIYRELTSGSGDSPKATDTVKVHYRGTLVNGKEFDSSYRRNEPAQFPLNKVIPCWTEGVQKMKAGGKAVLVCPSNLAYGDSGRPSIPGGATLVFEIELLGITGAAPLKQ
jgi:FKBP-type peptidyl-prolyl cis-trans isomerase FkpA